MESKDSSSPLSPPLTPIILSEEPPSPGTTPSFQTTAFASVGTMEYPDRIDIMGECSEGHILESRLTGRQLQITVRRLGQGREAQIYLNLRFFTEVNMEEDIRVEGGRISGSLRKL